MDEFSIRSIEFKNVNDLPTGDPAVTTLVGVNTNLKDFVKVPMDNLITDKLTADPTPAVSGITLIFNTSDRKYHIGKDYTSVELTHLNAIDTYLQRATNSGCHEGACTNYCVAVATSVSTLVQSS